MARKISKAEREHFVEEHVTVMTRLIAEGMPEYVAHRPK